LKLTTDRHEASRPLCGSRATCFICYINELVEVLSDYNVTVNFFADDLKLYAEILSNIDAANFQSALTQLDDWARAWQLAISVIKCSVLHIGNPIQVTILIN